ncbi:MAG TPA: 2-phosphosulfolactate phosphatase [Bacteroidales bacterium]|nr:2-phosphosulfolactate phosphatase [Bacteroidales bacterium]
MEKQKLETCFSPALYTTDDHSESVVVVIDVLRASSAICAAFKNGAKSIIPVSDIDTAREYKSNGYLVAAERDGFVLDFADFGNSPFNFIPEKIKGRTIVYSTTNGTGIIKTASGSHKVVIGTFNNISSVTEWLIRQEKPVLLFCAGWKNRFNLEDTICAGAFAEKLMESGRFSTICDSTKAALDLWKIASADLSGYIGKAAQRTRLRDKGLDDCIEYCLTADNTMAVPVVTDGILVDNNSLQNKFDEI